MTAVFDGHNDALTREDHAGLVSGRDGGHLDLPRMRAGGLRGAIFAVFTESPGFEWTKVERGDGVLEYAPAATDLTTGGGGVRHPRRRPARRDGARRPRPHRAPCL